MYLKSIILIFSICFSTTAIYAHEGISNETIKSRMNAMKEMANNMKVLGQMMKGTKRFDSKTAQLTAKQIKVLAAQTPSLFKLNITHPKSDAKPEIWVNYDDFVSKALGLEKVALEAGRKLVTESDLKNYLMSLGRSCKSCHRHYRK